jgi:hypothetical protein
MDGQIKGVADENIDEIFLKNWRDLLSAELV